MKVFRDYILITYIYDSLAKKAKNKDALHIKHSQLSSHETHRNQNSMRFLNFCRYLLALIESMISLLISMKIVCVDVHCWLWSMLFLCFQMQYTVAWVISFRSSEGEVGEARFFQAISSDHAEKMFTGSCNL